VALAAGVAVAGATPRRKVEELWPPPTDLARFHTLASGEVLTEVILPPVGENAYVEIRQKQSFDWALASAAVARNAKEGWRVVLGAVAPRPWRAAAAEEFLGSADLTAERIEKAAELAVRGGKPLTKNAYKVKLARVAVKRALTEAAGGAK
jgi:xanthine dehydrogenase YagS FAD-binding subunit